jgi:hypothetical protein
MADSAGECSQADTFAIYASHAEARGALKLLLGAAGDVGHGVVTQYFLAGPNWIIADFDRGVLKRLSAVLGGQIHHA